MKINVIMTMDIEQEPRTEDDLAKIYDEFRDIIAMAHESGDVTGFSFVNTETNMQIEEEMEGDL